eukprot:TRINITY_DN4366_c0_g1_i1.p1 TRINITY_DN4366_c0_g1~~TRINITY_DN4366_c0_g1_i1.p1  ORF type:complete len:199 (-),score=27.40 TRINITY_DN4366_c0_g1_i1:112-708(-)
MASKTQYKVVLLGEGCVGKTSLVMRYVSNTFNEKHITTIQALFVPKRLNLDGQSMTMNIWDTAGQEKYHALGPIYYRDADGAVLVYDITDVDSFNKVQTWVKELRKMLGKDIELIIAGNKSDMEKNRNVTLAEAEAYAASVGARHYSTSAKHDTGVSDMFLELLKTMAQKKPSAASRRGAGLLIVDDSSQNKKKGGCC